MQTSDFIPNPLRILHLEDDVDDADLIRRRLVQEQLTADITLVADQAGFETALKSGSFHAIFSDRSLKGYEGAEALEFVQKSSPGLPFIFVCGAIDEAAAIHAMQSGATDYVLKDQLGRLCATLRRALREVKERRERERAVRKLETFSKLGQQLSSVATPVKAAEIISTAADTLLGWDACTLDLFFPVENKLRPAFSMDLVGGKRVHVPPAYVVKEPSDLVRRILKEGAKLILRDGNPVLSGDLTPFGDANRPSASLMFVPVRNGDQPIGILSIQSYTPHAYSHESLNTLQALADHCGGALERIRAEEEVTRLAAIVASSDEAIIGKNLDGIITTWNVGAEQVFGYKAAEACGQSITILLPPDRQEEEQRVLEQVRRGERLEQFETVRVRKDGRLIDVLVAISPIKDSTGQVIGISKMAHDITEQKRSESALRRTEELYQRAISGVGAVPYVYDYLTRTYNFVGGGIVKLTGYSPEEITPDLWRRITQHSMMLGEAGGMTKDEAIRKGLAGEIRSWRCDSLIKTRNGEFRWIADSSIPNRDESGRPIGSIGILQDITERKEADKALRESEERFRRVVESEMLGIYFWESSGRIQDANDKFLAMTGHTREDLRAGTMDWLKLTPPEFAKQDEAALESLRVRGVCAPMEKEFLRKDGTRLVVLIGGSTLPGAMDKGVSFVLDIADRRRTESRLAALSKLGRNLGAAASPMEAAQVIAEMAQALFGWDALTLDSYTPEDDLRHAVLHMDTIDGKKTDVTPTGAESHRYPSISTRRVLALGSELILKEPPLRLTADESPFGNVNQPSASIMRVGIQYRAQTIGILSIHSYMLKAYDQSDLKTLQTFADYCAGALERIRAEEKIAVLHTQLINTARRAGMEEVATNVLHNVGNVLNSVNVSATMVINNLSESKLSGLERVASLVKTHARDLGSFVSNDPQGRQLPEYLEALAKYWAGEQAASLKELESLNKNILHIKNIVLRQQSFAGTSGFAESVFIPDLVEDALTIAASDLERLGITLAREYTVHFPVVVDKMKLMLILVNLISNAREALMESPQRSKQLKVRVEAHKTDRLRILVSDNGSGIAPENRTRIFSHGFTTKKSGHGFGLHSCAIAAKELNGSLAVESEGLGQGARFIVDLPLAQARKPEGVV